MKVSFANEIANLCGAVGASPDDVLRGIGYDRRIGPQYLRAGIGYGGPGLERDVKTIESLANRHRTQQELFSATLRVNESQPHRVITILESELGSLEGLVVGVWGLAFKAGTDVVSDSAAVRVVEDLGRRGARAAVYDPAVRVATLSPGSRLVTSPLEAAMADALVVLTDWPEFAQIDPRRYAGGIARSLVVDGRNVLDPDRVCAAGLTYRGVGRRFPAISRRLAAALLLK